MSERDFFNHNNKIRSGFLRTASFPGSKSRWANLEGMLTHHLLGIIMEVSRIQNTQKPLSESKRFVLAVKGKPVVGKTLTVENTGVLFASYLERIRINNNHIRSYTVTWEKDGEQAARDAGEIRTPRGKPLEDWELKIGNNRVKQAVKNSIENNISTVIEVPGEATATLIDGVWEGRDLGSSLQYNMETKSPPFNNLPDFDLNHISLVGSTFLRSVIGLFRWDYRNAPNLRSAQRIARLYGRKVPQTRKEWQESIDGAVSEELDLIDSVVIGIAEKLREKGKIYLPTDHHGAIGDRLSRELIEYQIDLMGALQRAEGFRQNVDYQVSNYFYTQVVQVPPERMFLGFNNPTPADLGIIDIEAIAKHLRESRKSISLKTSAVTP